MKNMKEKLKALKNKKGFTLIELIVVIAVIGILVLLAAPKFLGYTQDANKAAMQADAKVLSNAALVYNVENEAWPTTADAAKTYTIGAKSVTGKLLDETKLKSTVKSIKGKFTDYVIDEEGNVFHIKGVKGKDGKFYYGVNDKEDFADTEGTGVGAAVGG